MTGGDLAGRATAFAALLILIGALAVFLPYLLRDRSFSAGVPAPPALSTAAEYRLGPGQRACMGSVAVEPGARVAHFAARPATSASRPPVELSMSAPGYETSGVAPAGHGYKRLAVAIAPPPRAVLATACFVDRGRSAVALEGSSEARTVSRSPTTVAGAPVVGDVALAFSRRPERSLLSGLGLLFARASALTDGLMPVWLIWAIAALVALGVPVGALLALHWALWQDEQAPASA